MSDTINIKAGRANFDSLSRLRPGRFTSPSGVESSFLFDDLTRTKTKRTSSHEITDADTSIIQDLGSALQVFTMSVYFTGDDCDTEADRFFNSLYERYTPDKPGILNHPRWGDVPVIPFGTPEQNESPVSAVGISRVTVEFRETASLAFSSTSLLSASGIADAAGLANETALGRAKRIATTGAKSYAKFSATVKEKVNIISDTVAGVTDAVASVRGEIDAIKQGINDAITIGAAPAEILAQVSAMINTIVSTPQDTVDLVNSIIDMTARVIASFGDDIGNLYTSESVINTGLTLQCIAGACLSGCAIAGINVNYRTRDQVGGVVDALTEKEAEYSALVSTAENRISGDVIKAFNPDADIMRMMHGVVKDTQALLLNRSFSLRSRRSYRLMYPTDAMTETWTHYGDLTELGFYCGTNKITDSEFVEIPAGRELVVYV